MSFRKDSSGTDKEAGSTWYHEHGHYVDHNTSLPSRNMDFFNAIERDIIAFEDRWLSEHGMSRSDISVKDLRFRIGLEIVRYGNNLTHGIQDYLWWRLQGIQCPFGRRNHVGPHLGLLDPWQS